MKLQRPPDLRFELPDGRTFVVPQPTIGQLTRCMELDATPGEAETESQQEKVSRLSEQLRILCGSAVDVDSLSLGEAGQVLVCIVSAAHGLDPIGALALTNTIRAARAKRQEAR